MVFGRNINGTTYNFAASGLLRQSNLVMWDQETESWWQQGTAEAIVGTMTGTELDTIPARTVPFHDFKATFPMGTVFKGPLGQNTYNPYPSYDTREAPPYLTTRWTIGFPLWNEWLGFGPETRYERTLFRSSPKTSWSMMLWAEEVL